MWAWKEKKTTQKTISCRENLWLDLKALHTSRKMWTIFSPASSSPHSLRHGPRFSRTWKISHIENQYTLENEYALFERLYDFAIREENLTAVGMGLPEITASKPQGHSLLGLDHFCCEEGCLLCIAGGITTSLASPHEMPGAAPHAQWWLQKMSSNIAEYLSAGG